MPYTPTGPSMQRALLHLAGPDPFDQAALLRLFRRQPHLLPDDVRHHLLGANTLDDQAPTMTPRED